MSETDGSQANSGAKEGPVIDEVKSKPKPRVISRGRFLAGLGGLATLVTTGGVTLEDTTGAVSRLFAPDIDEIPSEIPPQLQGKDIPRNNEHHRTPLTVIKDAIDSYVKQGGKPFYQKPNYYLSQWEAAKTFVTQGFDIAFDTTGKPYDNAIKFGAFTYWDVQSIFDSDPGTGAKKLIERGLQAIPDPDALIVNDGRIGGPTKKDQVIARVYGDYFFRAKNYIDQFRGSGKVSTSELLKYFLQNSKGNIVQSLWDTTLFLKLVARVNLDTVNKIANWKEGMEGDTDISEASRRGAELISYVASIS